MFIKQTFAVIVNNRLLFGVFKDVLQQLSGVLLDSIKLKQPFLQSSHFNFEHKHYTSYRNIASDQPNNHVNMGSYILPEVQNKKFPIFRMLKGKQISVSLLMW
jgi:hypothetical protein